MTPTELAERFAPSVREAMERSKADILADIPLLKRQLVKVLWEPAMLHGIPIELRLVIELAIGKYREFLEPYMGDILELIKPLINVTAHPELLLLVDILEMLNTPSHAFLPVVQECLDPDVSHNIPTSSD